MDLNKPIPEPWPGETERQLQEDRSSHIKDEAALAPDLISCLTEFDPPITIVEPAHQTSPLVFSSPHSGRRYPQAFLKASNLNEISIRRSEDAFVDEIFSDMPSLGAPLLCAEFPRAFCDVNREAFELDPAMFTCALPEFANSSSLRVASGLGTIARVVADGEEIYRRKLTFADAQARVEKLYRPYHRALNSLLEKTKDQFGFAILVDCHSMPSKPSLARTRAKRDAHDIVLGDRFGTSCHAGVINGIERALRNQGLKVAKNDPFAGGFCTEYYGQPFTDIHAVQIEINRDLYMIESNLTRTKGLESLRQKLTSIIEALGPDIVTSSART